MSLTNSAISNFCLKWLIPFLFTFYLISALRVCGQTATSSFSSAYGIGEINSGAFSSAVALGSTGIGSHPVHAINFLNPASYSSLQMTVFETGVKSNFRKSSYSDSSFSTNNSSLQTIAFAFPVTKYWGMSFGLVPFSNSGYKIYSETNHPDIGKIHYQYESTGGTNQLYLGNGFKFLKNFSVGVNSSLLFGSIEKLSSVEFSDLSNSFNSRVTTTTSFANFYPGFGIQFLSNPLKTIPSDTLARTRKTIEELKNSISKTDSTSSSNIDSLKTELKKLENSLHNIKIKHLAGKWNFGTGLIFFAPAKINTRENILAERYRYGNGLLLSEDTTSYSIGNKKIVSLPPRLGIGFTLSNSVNWLFNLDATYSDWSQFDDGKGNQRLEPFYQLALGTEYIPNPMAVKKYYQKISYRGGIHYAQTFLYINGQASTDYGITFGFGLPIKKARSIVNLSADIGKRAGGGINEMNYNFVLGFTLTDKWFIRKKFD